MQILKIGYEKVKKELKLNTYFYKQLKLPYDYSYKYFSIPKDLTKSNEYEHLYNFYKVKSENFILIHSESSYEKYNLEISSSYDKIYINKESDIFKICSYMKN